MSIILILFLGIIKMNVTLISLDRELYCFGIRILSACLQKAGHQVKLLFMPPPESLDQSVKFQSTFSAELLDNLKSFCTDSDLIGISLMSNQLIPAINITEYLKSKKISAPVVWGGIQPTIEPEMCLEYADIVCIGEGEEALVELADNLNNGNSYHEIRNIWVKSQNKIFQNPLRHLVKELDTIPLPDYSCKNHFISEENRIVELTAKKFIEFQGERFRSDGDSIVYMFMTSRGCPYSCTYCCNSILHSLYPKQKLLRWRSIENVIDELKTIQKEIAPISFVYMVDDNFTARSKDALEHFCKGYKTEIGIPFFAQISPRSITEEKMEILFNSGCAKVTMGIESANERISKMYNRSKEYKVLQKAITLVEKYRQRMTKSPTYHFIIDNPYEKIEETLETLRMAVSFPRPWHNPIYSLMLFPGVPLYEKAIKDGLIKDKHSQIYGKNWRSQSKPFFQFWIRLYRANFSPSILRILLKPWLARLLTCNIADFIWKMPVLRLLWKKIG